MAIRKGICGNIDNCSKAIEQEVQILDKKEIFVCQECGQPLIPVKEGKELIFPLKTILILVAVLFVAAGGATAYFFRETLFGPEAEAEIVKTEEPVILSEAEAGSEEGNAIISENTQPDEARQMEPVPVADQTIATLQESGMEEDEEGPMAENDFCVLNEEDMTPQELNIGYAVWYGKIFCNLPHDTEGKMTFTSRHIIEPRDEKKRVADKGDYIIGEYNEGHLVQGRWYGADGNYKGSLLIGLPQK